MKTLENILDELPAERRKEVKARAAQLIAEEATLQELRKAHRKTQTQLARKLRMTPGQVSRLEQRSDLPLSTLRKFVEGMDAELSLIAEFPAHNPVKLAGFSALDSVVASPIPVRRASSKRAIRRRP
jgi:transcriptional regulator with XRE-family HTH domain